MTTASPTTRTLSALVVASTLMLATACGDRPEPDGPDGSPGQPTGSPTAPATGRITDEVEVLATGLSVPWAVAFLPDGDALVTERTTGRILRLDPDRPGQLIEVQRIPVDPAGEGGLLGIAVSPDYERDGLVYVYYTTDTDNRIARFRLGGEPEPILTGIPSAGNHNGGRLVFGPDGYLYVGTGDAGVRERSQDLDSLAGKILRITPDGQPAPGNPFGTRVWAYGLRNVQGLAFDADGRLWATEFGQNAFDEINLIEPGGNYGWPVVEGPTADARYRDPVAAWPPAEASCSGAAVVGTTLVAACLRGQRLWLLELDGDRLSGEPRAMFTGEYGRLREAVVAPDGSLWLTTSNWDGRLPGGPGPDDDRILRVAVRS